MSTQTLLPKTKLLLFIAAMVSAVVLLDHGQLSVPQAEERVRLDAVDPSEVHEIELVKATESVKLSRAGDRWMIQSPFEARADFARVQSLLMAFRKGVIFDALIDSGDDRRYGMDAATAVSVVLRDQMGGELISIVVGKDTEQGSSYVRLSNSTDIYRAQLGRRQRFDQAPEDWRNQLLVDLSPEQVQALYVSSSASTFEVKSEPSEGAQLRWSLVEGEQQFNSEQLDQQKLLKLVQRVGHLRIGQEVSTELPNPSLELRVVSSQGEQILRFGEPNQGRVLVSFEDRVYEVASPLVEQVLQGSRGLLNRRLFRYVPRQDFDTIGLQQSGQALRLLQQDLSTGFWRLVRPSNVSIDPREAFFAVNTFAGLEHLGGDVSESLESDSAVVLTLQLLTGQKHEIQIFPISADISGGKTAPLTCVIKVDGGPPQVILQESLDTIAQGFGLESIF